MQDSSELISLAGAALDQVPEPIRTGAFTAISRLLGAAASIPEAYLRLWAGNVNNKADAQKAAWSKIGPAVGDRVASDESLMERATQTLLGDGFIKQKNREAVALETVKLLSETTEETENQNPSPEGEAPQERPAPSEDWMNIFVDYAEKASSQKLQALWARVLSGEIRSPGQFSPVTMRFVAELDQATANLFESVSIRVFSNDFILKENTDPRGDITKYLRLEEAGLINYGSGMLSKVVTAPDNGNIVFGNINPNKTGCAVVVHAPAGKTFHIPAAILTRVGREIYQLIRPPDRSIASKEVAKYFSENGADKVDIYHISQLINGALFQSIEKFYP